MAFRNWIDFTNSYNLFICFEHATIDIEKKFNKYQSIAINK